MFFFEISFNFLSALYSEFGSPILKLSFRRIFSGTVLGLFGKLYDKGKFKEIEDLYCKLKNIFNDRFYLEIQRHGDNNESEFEKFNLLKSNDLKIPIIATTKALRKS